jgi:hypothetical protein
MERTAPAPSATPLVGRVVAWAVAGALGGAGCLVGDHLHVAYGVLFYPHPAVWQQAWWVFPLFFFATLSVLLGVPLLYRGAPSETPVRAAAGDFGAFLAAYAFSALASPWPDVVLGVLLVAWLARALRGMPRGLMAFCGVVAVLGTGFEIGLSGAGGFSYVHPDFLGVPRWLPALYLHAALAGASAAPVVNG